MQATANKLSPSRIYCVKAKTSKTKAMVGHETSQQTQAKAIWQIQTKTAKKPALVRGRDLQNKSKLLTANKQKHGLDQRNKK